MTETPCLPNAGPIHGGGGAESNCYGDYLGTQQEDCLFLDVYVPLGVANGTISSVPVAVWLYGGAFLFGSKTQYNQSVLPFYDGQGFIHTAQSSLDSRNNNLIFVTGNYRLGAFGWLAGDSFKKSGGQSNAGLLDQRAMLKFVRDQIKGVGGDPQQVSLWGESAGASSIMHHLTMKDNIGRNPLFRRAILQSPAFQWLWDEHYTLDDTWTTFWRSATNYGSEQSLCKPNQDPLDCLRSNPKVTSSILNATNQALFQDAACEGVMPVGPSVDGDIVPRLAPISLAKGEIADIESLIVSHVDLEVPYATGANNFSFIPLNIRKDPNNPKEFDKFLSTFLKGPPKNQSLYQPVRLAIDKQYPEHSYTDQVARAAAMIGDVSFYCNTRFIIDAYIKKAKPVYAMDYAVLMEYNGTVYNGSTHASDLLPAFSNLNVNYTPFFHCFLPEKYKDDARYIALLLQGFAGPLMQEHFGSFAIFGHPNNDSRLTPWNPASNSAICSDDSDPENTCVTNVMRLTTAHPMGGINDWTDTLTPHNTCQFWYKASVMTAALYSKAVVIDEEVELLDVQGSDQIVFAEL